MAIKHTFTSPKADGPDTTKVRPSNWNADHLFQEAGGASLLVGSIADGQFFKRVGGSIVGAAAGEGAVGGTGTVGQVAFWATALTLSGSPNLRWDNTNNRLGIKPFLDEAESADPLATIDMAFNAVEGIRIMNANTDGLAFKVRTPRQGGVSQSIFRVFSNPSLDGANTEGWILAQSKITTITSSMAGNLYSTLVDATFAGSAAGPTSLQALQVILQGGYTGPARSRGIWVRNLHKGTDFNSGIEIFSDSGAPDSTKRFGLRGVAQRGNVNIGLSGEASLQGLGTTKGIGIFGQALGHNTDVGGAFFLKAVDPTTEPVTSAALLADNGATTAPIFLARDNGTIVFIVADGGTVGIGTSIPDELQHNKVSDAGTTNVPNILKLEHESSGTPAVGFGTGMLFAGKSATISNRDMARIRTAWNVATDATRSSALHVDLVRNGVAALLRMLSIHPAVDQTSTGMELTGGNLVLSQGTLSARADGSGEQDVVVITNAIVAALGAGPRIRAFGQGNAEMGKIVFAWNAANTANSYVAISARLNSQVDEFFRVQPSGGGIFVNPPARVGIVRGMMTIRPPADTNITASSEVTDIDFDLSNTKQWATGNIAAQRPVKFRAPTYSFVAGSTITDASTVYIENAPIAGVNATIVNPYALWIDAGRVRIDQGVALGGGTVATLGTIGGSGPTIATQNEWIEVTTQTGRKWVPAWA